MSTSDFFLVASVLCILAKTKAGVVLGWRLRDKAVSFPRALESWDEVRAAKKRWVLGGDAPCVGDSDPSEFPRLVRSHAH